MSEEHQPGPDTDASRRRRRRTLAWTVGGLLAAGLFALVMLLSVSDDGGDAVAPQVGARAPDFTVPTLDGGTFSLQDHIEREGRPVFLNLWASWCFPCREEMPAIDAAARRHPEVDFVGVVVDDDEAPARTFVEEREIGYRIGIDEDRVVKEEYWVRAMPSTYLIGRDGSIVEAFFGPLALDDLEEMVAGLVSSATG